MIAISLAQLLEKLDMEAVIHGDENVLITGIAAIHKAVLGDITFLSDSKYHSFLATAQMSVVVLKEKDLPFCSTTALVVENPYLAYAHIAQILDTTPLPAEGIAKSAVLANDVQLGKGISIGANAVIESGVKIGNNTIIGAGCFIGQGAQIGDHTRLWSNVSVYHRVVIGHHCLIQSGAVIGADGFGYANDRGSWVKIPQLGSVIIGNRVEIGACTTIDRGALEDTVINDGVIIDNQCQIAHNNIIGAHTAIAGGAIMAGSLEIGKYCKIGGASVINGHMSICDETIITGMSMVMRPITEPGVYSSGIPAQPNKEWRKMTTLTMGIDNINKRLKQVEHQLDPSEKKE